jgi:hypothetical protein
VVIFDPQKITYFYIVIIPIVIFWLFDCYYLGMEKTFRSIYEDFLEKIKNDNTNICDDVKIVLKGKRCKNFFKAILSASTTPLYGALIIIVIILYYAIKSGGY